MYLIKDLMQLGSLSSLFILRQFEVGKNIYDTKWKCDFILYHPEQSGGSVDEKISLSCAKHKQQGIDDTIIIIDGDGYKKEALKWLKDQVGSNLIEVFSMSEFTSWVNKKKI
ncbi:DNA adenine methyltransferases (MboA)-like domain protein [Rickettsia rhipicephali str. Ect]|uniref:DNA adenine methyltransferases (MboA)-like domain protein n=3 Tax=Rickettsia TaxID=780 RepID=A0A0F3PF33_RICRH|nr:Site-specific DNA methylase [Rickettsia massiliae str. AZT80]KJV78893.1 DNA adenine methyltransferases (MboA)-like domain protein [Rickettsia rhipicephali str. Ect]